MLPFSSNLVCRAPSVSPSLLFFEDIAGSSLLGIHCLVFTNHRHGRNIWLNFEFAWAARFSGVSNSTALPWSMTMTLSHSTRFSTLCATVIIVWCRNLSRMMLRINSSVSGSRLCGLVSENCGSTALQNTRLGLTC